MKKGNIIGLSAAYLFTTGAVLLGSCGGGGGSSQPQADESSSLKTYMAYLGSIMLVDPDDIGNKVQVLDSYPIDIKAFSSVNEYTNETKEFKELHIDSLVWVEELDGDSMEENGGPIFVTSLIKGTSTPSKVQISNLNNACNIAYIPYFIKSGRQYMVVKTAGADNKCGGGDEEYFIVHTDMSPTDTPMAIPSGKKLLTHFGNMNTQGYLLIGGGDVSFCTSDMTCDIVKFGATNAKSYKFNPSTGNNYLCVDDKLYEFDGTNLNDLSVDCISSVTPRIDSTALYLIDSNNVKKLPHGGSSWETIYSDGDALSIRALTENYIILKTMAGVKAVSKNGSVTVMLSDKNTNLYLPYGDKFFFQEKESGSPAKVRACVWQEGAISPTCTENSYWAGLSLAPEGRGNLYNLEFVIGKLIRVEEVVMNGTYPTGGKAFAVNLKDGSELFLGDVPENVYIAISGFFPVGDKFLVSGLNVNTSDLDVFFIDLSQPNSLQNITNTPGVKEMALF
ncbi:hypothetical protein [Hydrogenivirga sp.]